MEKPYQDSLDFLLSGGMPAFKQVFEAQHPVVCQAIFRLVKDEDTSRELAQKVFIKLWEKHQHLNISGPLSAYVRRMAVNEALYFLRRQKRFETEDVLLSSSSFHGSPTEHRVLVGDLKSHYKEALTKLPEKCQAIFVLSRHEGLTYPEIARQMQVSVKTVENQMGKALKILRESLKDFLQ